MTGVLRVLNTQFAALTSDLDEDPDVREKISNAAAFLRLLSQEIDSVADVLLDALTKPESASILLSPLLLRAIFASLLSDDERLDLILDRSFAKFSDELFIKHGTILQQEMNAQLVLLAVGHFHQSIEPLKAGSLRSAVRSSEYLNGVSKHLSSSSTRSRWLGMLVANTVSAVADSNGAQIAFDDESLTTPEAEWYKSLIALDDEPSDTWSLLDLFGQDVQLSRRPKSMSLTIRKKKDKPERPKKKTERKSSVVQVIDDDIVGYAKPDSDPEDEEEDPTLINRDKPRPPV
jgi:telomere length regulation protein